MKDRDRTKEELMAELGKLRQRVTELEASGAERKRAEEEIIKFKTIADVAHYGVGIADPDGTMTYANEALARMHGYAPDEIIGQHFPIFYTEEQLEAVEKLRKQCLEKGSFVGEEVWRKRKDGTVFPSSMSMLSVRDDKGKLLYISAVVIDISERKRAESRINYLAEILENSPFSVITTDDNGIITYINRATERLFGYTKQELIGKSQIIFNAEPNAEEIQRDILDTVQRGEVWRGEILSRKKNGELFYTGANIYRLLDTEGNPIAFVGFQRDITERKQAEQELRESEERYRALVHLGAETGEAVVMLQDDERGVGMHVFASEAWSRITGYSIEELLNISMADLIHPRDRAEAVERHNRRMQGEELPGLYEINIIRKDGTEVPVEGTYAFSHYRGKRVNVGYIRDITERRQAEEALQLRSHLLNNASDSIIAVDLEGNIVYANDTACRAHGYTKEEMLEMNLRDTATPELLGLVPGRIEKVIEDGYLTFESKHRRKDGSAFPVEITSRTMKLNEKNVILSVTRDITERKKAEEALRESEEFNSSVLRNSPNPILVANADTSIRYVNPALEKLAGFSLKELVGQKTPRPWWPEEMYEKLEHDAKLAYRRGFKGHEYLFKKKNGERFWVQITATPVIIEGEFRHFIDNWVDITERKRMEEELRQSDERFRQIADNAQEWIWEIDANGMYTYASHIVEEIMGYTPDEIVGKKHFYDLFHPEDREELKEAAFKAFAEKQPFHDFVNRNIHKNDSVVWLSTSGVPILNEDGKLVGYRGADTDITERKLSEEALRESEERLALLYDEAPVGYHELDKEGRITQVNRTELDMLGYTAEEMLGQHVWDFMVESEASRQAFAAKMASTMPTGQAFERTYRRKDGTTFPVLIQDRPVRDESRQIIGLRSTIQDITERKQIEEELIRNRDYLEKLNDSMTDIIFNVKFPERTIQYVNKSVETVLGYKPEECIGQSIEMIYPSHEVYQEVGRRIRKGIEQGADLTKSEHELKRKDGRIIIVEGRTNILREDGEVATALSLVRDITERKKMEEEHQRSTRLESLSTLAGGIAHDFNNLLTGILGNVSLAKRYVEPDSKAADRLTEAERASIRARDLTQQLLTFSRGGAPVKKTVSIGHLLVDATSFALRGSNIRPEFLLADRLWPVDIDEGQITQVLTNLVINSSDAMPQGGTIQVIARNLPAKEARRLNLTPRKYVEVTVADQGVGIPAEHINRIFEPYFTTKQKGSGLGLATVYSIIENHDGRITVESKVGKGTTFHIYLPVSRATAAKADEPPADVPITGRGKILVMDDEDIIREFLYHELTEVGYDVIVVSDGAEAVAQYEKAKNAMESFDAVILDLTVSGGMGGKETIKKLRKLDPKVKAIASSGYATDPIMAKHKKYGFRAVVAKPYRVDELEKTLHNVLKPKQ